MRAVWLLALFAGCKCNKPPNPEQITTNLVVVEDDAASATDATVAYDGPCADPKTIAFVGEVPKRLHWMLDVLTDDVDAYDVDTLQKQSLARPDASGMTSATPPAGYEIAWKGRGLKRLADGAAVFDVASGKELYRRTGCRSNIEESPYGLSKSGRLLECWADRNTRIAWSIDDPSHPSETLNQLFDDVPPDDSYVVSVPIQAMNRRALEWRAMFGTARGISLDVEPIDYRRHMKIAFCGTGRLFAAYATVTGEHPTHVQLFRGEDGVLLATAPSAPPGGLGRQQTLSFDASGTHLLLMRTDYKTHSSVVYRLVR